MSGFDASGMLYKNPSIAQMINSLRNENITREQFEDSKKKRYTIDFKNKLLFEPSATVTIDRLITNAGDLLDIKEANQEKEENQVAAQPIQLLTLGTHNAKLAKERVEPWSVLQRPLGDHSASNSSQWNDLRGDSRTKATEQQTDIEADNSTSFFAAQRVAQNVVDPVTISARKLTRGRKSASDEKKEDVPVLRAVAQVVLVLNREISGKLDEIIIREQHASSSSASMEKDSGAKKGKVVARTVKDNKSQIVSSTATSAMTQSVSVTLSSIDGSQIINIVSGSTHVVINATEQWEQFKRTILDAALSQEPKCRDAILATITGIVGKANADGLSELRVYETSFARADANKDGTPEKVLDEFARQKQQFSDGIKLNNDQLKTITHAVKDYLTVTQEITRVVFARTDKDNPDVLAQFKNIPFDIEFDCGSFSHIDMLTCIFTGNWGKYIDPSKCRIATECFPPKGIKLSISKEVFELYGFKECYITHATNIGHDKYAYDVVISGNRLNNNSRSERKYDENIKKIFVGNSKKDVSDHVCVVAKALGDKLQGEIHKIKSVMQQNSGRVFCMITCDMNVFTNCVKNQLPCFYTGIDVVELDGAKNVKVNEVYFYNKGGATLENVLVRFTQEFKSVYSQYENIKTLLTRSVTEGLRITGIDGKTFTMDPNLSSLMINDLTDIQNFMVERIHGEVISLADAYQIGDASDDRRKIMLGEINKLTNTVIGMTPSSIVKSVDRTGVIRMLLSSDDYFDYKTIEEHLNYSEIQPIITKFRIGEFIKENGGNAKRKNYKSYPFSDAVRLLNVPQKGGGKFMIKHVKNSHANDFVNELMETAHNIENLCFLDQGFSLPDETIRDDGRRDGSYIEDYEGEIDDNPDYENVSVFLNDPQNPFRSGVDSDDDTDPRVCFSITESLYEELFFLYEQIYSNSSQQMYVFPLEDFIYEMVDHKLSILRQYDSRTLHSEMIKLNQKMQQNRDDNLNPEVTDETESVLISPPPDIKIKGPSPPDINFERTPRGANENSVASYDLSQNDDLSQNIVPDDTTKQLNIVTSADTSVEWGGSSHRPRRNKTKKQTKKQTKKRANRRTAKKRLIGRKTRRFNKHRRRRITK